MIKDGQAAITSTTPGASIGYKIVKGGDEPPTWCVYTSPVACRKGDRVLAVAHRIGYKKGRTEKEVTTR